VEERLVYTEDVGSSTLSSATIFEVTVNKITLYKIYDQEPRTNVRVASKEREWMEANSRFAYRCLPLTIANQHGWTFSLKEKVCAEWNGVNELNAIKIESSSPMVGSHFGNGILTFSLDYLFELQEGYSLYISGPPNNSKNNIVPLTGMYEADWAPYSFTMNWKFTEANRPVVFEKDEPFCFIFPIQRNLIESFTLETKNLSDNPELKNQFFEWSSKRKEFNKNPDRKAEDWQKQYFRGEYPDGSKCPYDHKTKLNIKLES
jgi:hypothetical protein